MADKYCSAQFKTGEELDAALKAALDTCDYSVAASECRQAAEKHRAEAEVSEHNAEVYAEGGKLEAHEGQTVSPEEIPGAKGYMEQAQSHKRVASIQAENAKAYAEGGTPFEDVGDDWFIGGLPTLGAKGYVDQAKVYVEGGEAPMTPPELGDGVVQSHGAKNLADRAAAYSVGGDYREYYRGGTWETIHVEKGAMQYAEEARLAAEQTKKDVQDATNSADEAENFAIEARKMYMNAADAYSGAAAASGWAKIYADEAKNAAASGGGGSGGGGVSSWNDLTDKPFGEENGILLPEITVAFDESGQALLMKPTGMVADRAYTVNWNGTDYFCLCVYYEADGSAGLVIGNLEAVGAAEPGSGFDAFPFVIVDGGEETLNTIGAYGMIMSLAGDESATFSIRGMVVTPIDTKYLPKHLQFGDKVEEVLSKRTLTSTNGEFSVSTPLSLTAGNLYTVNWNGVEYECWAVDSGTGAVILGNLAAFEGVGDTGQPFLIMVSANGAPISDGRYGAVVSLNGESEVSISITGEVQVPIKEKYLPEQVGSAVVINFATGADPTEVVCDTPFEKAIEYVNQSKALFARRYSPSSVGQSTLYTMSEFDNDEITFFRVTRAGQMEILRFYYDGTCEITSP